MRFLRGFIDALNILHVQIVLAWVGIIFLLVTINYWIQSRIVSKREGRDERYLILLNVLAIFALALIGLAVIVVTVIFIGVVFERNGYPYKLTCLTPFVIIGFVILISVIRRKILMKKRF